MADLTDLTLENFKLWTSNALRIYLSRRKKYIWEWRRKCQICRLCIYRVFKVKENYLRSSSIHLLCKYTIYVFLNCKL